jgi:hypothetical protein
MAENAFWSGAKHTFSETDLNHFKTWQSVQSIPIYAFQQFEQQYAQEVFGMISTLSVEDQNKWFSVLKEPFLGHTSESYSKIKRNVQLGQGGLIVETSPWALKSAHHLLTYLTNSKWKLDDFAQIVEFGPGIGEVCRIVTDLGFKGDYYLYDLPEVLKISTYYNSTAKGVTHYSQIDNTKKTLFIATWSLSEIPFETRNEIVTHFKTAEYLIIFQKQAFEYSNSPYFMITFPSLIDREVEIRDIEFLNHIAGGNYYLFTK